VAADEDVDHRDMENLLRDMVVLLSKLSAFGLKIELTELRHEEREDLLLAIIGDDAGYAGLDSDAIYIYTSHDISARDARTGRRSIYT